MKGFKDSTKTQYAQGGSNCYAKGGAVKGAAKVAKVTGEFKKGELHSGSKKGPEVTNPKQATAIALSEARNAGAKIPPKPVKKSLGGVLKALSPAYQLATSDVGQKIMGSGALGVGGILLKDLMKKKQSGGTLTPAEEKQVAAAGPQTAMKKGGKVVKKARGGAVGDAVDRGNRSQELESREEEGMIREGARRAARGAKNKPYAEPKETITRETITRSAPMVPIRRGPNGAGYKNSPLIPDVIEGPLRSMGIIGRKAGGLSAMPKGKK